MTNMSFMVLTSLFPLSIIGDGAYAGCVYCKIKGEYSKTFKKMVYLGHRWFLTPIHPLHDDTTLFLIKKINIIFSLKNTWHILIATMISMNKLLMQNERSFHESLDARVAMF